MRITKVIERRIRRHGGGIDLVADVRGALAANVNEPGSKTTTTSSSSSSVNRIVQRSTSRRAKPADPEEVS